ncbi:MAG TPA: hypothetical protein VGE52_09855 [Pirellulales bacterium]
MTRSDEASSSDQLSIRADDDASPWAIVREEPWPEIADRPWPDGLKNLPWWPWLMGHARATPRVRTVVRRGATGAAVLRLHRRSPIFQATIGIFDAADARIGYARGDFKSGLGTEFALVGIDHRVLGWVRRLTGETFRLAPPSGEPEWGRLSLGRNAAGRLRTCHAAESEALADFPQIRLLLLAAVLLCWQTQAAGVKES